MEAVYLPLAIVLLSLLSFANGSNDVSKSVATLAGSGITSVRKAIYWGTIWTVAGGLSGMYWGLDIVRNITHSIFNVSNDASASLVFAIIIPPALWVLIASKKGWAVSTTHAVMGGMIGAGAAAFGSTGIAWHTTLNNIALPLIVTPLLALFIAYMASPFLKNTVGRIGRYKLCLFPAPKFLTVTSNKAVMMVPESDCVVCECNAPQAAGNIGIHLTEDQLHWFTSGLLSFARGLNDAPKLIAVIMPIALISGVELNGWLFLITAIAMGAGGIISGKKVTQMIGFKVTKMNHDQGFAANLVSSFLVIIASRFGMPVSITHVSVASIMGVGLSGNKGLNLRTVKLMLLAWIITVPAVALMSAGFYLLTEKII